MNKPRRIAAQRRVVLEELKTNTNDVVFDLLAEILSIERVHRDRRYGVRPDIKAQIERVADRQIADQQ